MPISLITINHNFAQVFYDAVRKSKNPLVIQMENNIKYGLRFNGSTDKIAV